MNRRAAAAGTKENRRVHGRDRSDSRETPDRSREIDPRQEVSSKQAKRIAMMKRSGMFDNRDEERKRRAELIRLEKMGYKAFTLGARRLMDEDCDVFDDIIADLQQNGASIQRAMSWCLDRSDFGQEIAGLLLEAVCESGLPSEDYVARLYLLSDVVLNSGSVTQPAAQCYRREIEAHLPSVFEHLHTAYRSESSRVKASRMSKQVFKVLHAWETHSIFAPEYVRGLEATFSKDIVSAEEILSNFDENTPVFGGLLAKLREWRAQHFSQLEKIGKARGLICQTNQVVERPLDGRSLEEVKMAWILDRLCTYEIHLAEVRAKQPSSNSASGKASRRSSNPVPFEEDSDVSCDGAPIDPEMDGESLTGGDLDAVQAELDGEALSNGELEEFQRRMPRESRLHIDKLDERVLDYLD